jgi:hypothetical protein
MQQGRCASRLIERRVAGQSGLLAFRYFDKGTMAQFLAMTGLRVSVPLQWLCTFLTGQRGSRLVVSAREPAAAKDRPQPALSARTA